MSVYQRGRVWYYDFQIEARRCRKRIPAATTKAQALHAEAVARQELFHGEYGRPKGAMLFREFVIAHYLPYAHTNNRSLTTIESVCRELASSFGEKHLAEITPLLIEKFKRERLATPTRRGTARAPATVNVALSFLSKILSLAIDQRELHENPCRRVKLLRVDNARNRYLSRAEEVRLDAALEFYPTLRVIVTVALNTGMRRGEIMKLRWSEIDLSRETIIVTNTKSARDRLIPLNQAARAVLVNLDRAGEFVFPGNGGREHQRFFEGSWKVVCEAAELEDFHFHDLRHTAATRMIEGGADAFTVSALLGHSRVQMTARYAHATSESCRRAVAALASDADVTQTGKLRAV